MYHGIININKPAGFTSHDVVAKLRGMLRQKKIGHTGTLDPEATGVLPVCLGRGTKLCDMLTDKHKVYEAEVLLGVETDTQDMTGTVIKTSEVTVTPEAVLEAVMSFKGHYNQIPPMYSALKVDGRKLYDLAREGKVIERKARPVEIHEIEILSMDLPQLKILVNCSKGTYIRTLCHDLGQQLGCGGAMKALLRTQVGRFKLEDALTLEQVQAMVDAGELDQAVLPVDAALGDCRKIKIQAPFEKLLYNGNPLLPVQTTETGEPQADEKVRIYDTEDRFIGLYQYDSTHNRFKNVKMFL